MSRLTNFNRNRALGTDNIYNIFDDLFNSMPLTLVQHELMNPSFKVDVKEETNEYIIEAEMPGISKEEIRLELNEGRLDIAVERQEEKKEERKNYLHQERYYSSMSRSVYLASAGNKDIQAKLSDGLLKITVPKEEQSTKQNKIEIQ